MNPFRRWRDEPVGRAATSASPAASMGAFAMKQSPVQRSPHHGTGRASIATECASRAQFYEGQLWLSNLSTC
jgi:hypothetical protein